MEENLFLLLTSQKINVHIPDINGGKSSLISNFVSIFTSLRYLVRHLSIDACKKMSILQEHQKIHIGETNSS